MGWAGLGWAGLGFSNVIQCKLSISVLCSTRSRPDRDFRNRTGPDRIGTPDPVDRTGPDRIPDQDIDFF